MTISAKDIDPFQRSSESHAFEAFWRSLRKDGLVPRRTDFQPGKALRFLRDIVLSEGPDASNALRVRVAGERVNQTAGCNLTGQDTIGLLPPQYRPGAVATSHLMVNQPCGLWQITPIHLARGYALPLELTGFPLAPEEGQMPFYLFLVRPTPSVLPASLPLTAGVAFDTATQFRFLDIGAGEPVWAEEAA